MVIAIDRSLPGYRRNQATRLRPPERREPPANAMDRPTLPDPLATIDDRPSRHTHTPTVFHAPQQAAFAICG